MRFVNLLLKRSKSAEFQASMSVSKRIIGHSNNSSSMQQAHSAAAKATATCNWGRSPSICATSGQTTRATLVEKLLPCCCCCCIMHADWATFLRNPLTKQRAYRQTINKHSSNSSSSNCCSNRNRQQPHPFHLRVRYAEHFLSKQSFIHEICCRCHCLCCKSNARQQHGRINCCCCCCCGRRLCCCWGTVAPLWQQQISEAAFCSFFSAQLF